LNTPFPGEIMATHSTLSAAARLLRAGVPLALAFSLSACSTGGLLPRSQPIALPTGQSFELPATVSLSPAQWPSEDWWRRFGDPQLDRIIAHALAENPGLRLAQARIDQASAMSGLAGAALEPRIDGTATSNRQRFSEHGTTPAPVAGTWNYVTQATLGVQYELDFWGRNRETLAGAIGREHAAEIDAAAARLMLSAAMVQAYIALQNTDDEIAIEQAQLQRQQDILALTMQRVEAQLDSQIDLKQAMAALPVRRAAIAALRERRELLEHELAALMGLSANASLAIERPGMHLPERVTLPSAVPAELVGRRPDVVAQRWRVEAAGHDIAAAKANFYPNINLVASIGKQSLGFEHLGDASTRIFGVGPTISLPIFEGGRLRAGLALQNANYDAAVETYNSTVLAALRDVADQLSSMKWLQTRMEELQQAVSTAKDAADLVRERYAVGLTNHIEVLIAEDTVLQQRRALIDLQAHALSLDAALTRAIGGALVPAASAVASAGPAGRVNDTPYSSADIHDK
jgi:NodT family efflux transporter outer membrane factor (OMF) lipoprotein